MNDWFELLNPVNLCVIFDRTLKSVFVGFSLKIISLQSEILPQLHCSNKKMWGKKPLKQRSHGLSGKMKNFIKDLLKKLCELTISVWI